jgi:Flp pilus assembly CpaF family ATPase
MKIRFNKIGQIQQSMLEVTGTDVRIGSHPQGHVVLKSPFVAKMAAIVSYGDSGWELTSTAENEIKVGGHVVHAGEKTLLLSDTSIEIYPYELFIDGIADRVQTGPNRERLNGSVAQILIQVHQSVLAKIDLNSETYRPDDVEFLREQENNIAEFAKIRGLLAAENKQLLEHCAGLTLQGEVLMQVLDSVNLGAQWKNEAVWSELHTAVVRMESELQMITEKIRRALGVDEIADKSACIEIVEREFWPQWEAASVDLYPELLEYLGMRYIKKQIKDIMFGYGPLEDLLRLPNISEIMVVSRDQIYVEKKGVIEKTGRSFVSDEVTISVIDRIVSKVGRRIDKSEPLVDARLIDGSRVNAVIPPIAINGPSITIRKFPDTRLTVQDLIGFGALTPAADRFLEAVVIMGANILVSGGTGSGKTTLLNCLSDYIPDKDRIVTIEDTAELQLAKEHVVRMETKAANVEGRGEYDIRDLVKNSLRMRPDRIVVGECRGPEALDMLQAMNTGHDGSMTTIHANTSQDVILRLEVLVQQAADLPVQSIHRQIASAIDIVVQLARLDNGRRCVTQITQFVDYDEIEKRIMFKDIFAMGDGGHDAKLVPTGSLPTFMPKLMSKNLLDLDLFYS